MLRPQPARWFEILAAKDDATVVLAALAATGEVELEARPAAAAGPPLSGLEPLVAEFDDLTARYGPYWPERDRRCSAFPESPLATLGRSLDALRAWAREAEPIIRELQRIESERDELVVWQRVLRALDGAAIDFARLGASGPIAYKRLFLFPANSHPEFPPELLAHPVDQDGALCVLVVGSEAALRSLAQQAATLHGRALDAPTWLKTTAQESIAYVPPRLHALERQEASLRAALEALHDRHDLYRALGDAQRLEWVMHNVRALETTELFCWVTGWTSDRTGERLAATVERSGARALLRFPPASDSRAPLLLANPWWAKPFELFSRALGMPARNEADPSTLLAIAVPLMFGYMFGDVGQGLVIATVAFVLRRRFAVARLLVAGGLAAAVFGALFGSFFSTHLLHPLWIAPLAAPLTVLLVPIAGGALLLGLGLVLNALEAYWRGELRHWLATDAGFVLCYAGLLGAVLRTDLAVLAVAGTLLFCAGHAVRARDAKAALPAIAELAERLTQILVNTLSFARIGAFALAHAGLSSAIVALASAAGSPIVAGVVLVLGNALVLALETMVVSIQTTRLVLFEFFTRFLTASGRVFRPLPPPPSMPRPQET